MARDEGKVGRQGEGGDSGSTDRDIGNQGRGPNPPGGGTGSGGSGGAAAAVVLSTITLVMLQANIKNSFIAAYNAGQNSQSGTTPENDPALQKISDELAIDVVDYVKAYVNAQFQTLSNLIAAAPVVPQDGGATFKSSLGSSVKSTYV